MKRIIGILVFTAISSLFSHSSLKASATYWPPLSLAFKNTDEANDEQKKPINIITGLASFYSRNLEGTLTATGEIFHHANFTAASNFFALNTWVRVTNILTGKSIIVRINDRMHPNMAKKGRIVDLTYTGAKQLHMIDAGVVKVKVEPISKDDVASAK